MQIPHLIYGEKKIKLLIVRIHSSFIIEKFAAITHRDRGDERKKEKSRLITFAEYCVQCSLLLFAHCTRINLDVNTLILYFHASALHVNARHTIPNRK